MFLKWNTAPDNYHLKTFIQLKELQTSRGFPGGSDGKEPACSGRPGFDPWVRKIPWRTEWQPTPVFLPGEPPWTEEPGGLQSMGPQRVGHDRATKHTHKRLGIRDGTENDGALQHAA